MLLRSHLQLREAHKAAFAATISTLGIESRAKLLIKRVLVLAVLLGLVFWGSTESSRDHIVAQLAIAVVIACLFPFVYLWKLISFAKQEIHLLELQNRHAIMSGIKLIGFGTLIILIGASMTAVGVWQIRHPPQLPSVSTADVERQRLLFRKEQLVQFAERLDQLEPKIKQDGEMILEGIKAQARFPGTAIRGQALARERYKGALQEVKNLYESCFRASIDLATPPNFNPHLPVPGEADAVDDATKWNYRQAYRPHQMVLAKLGEMRTKYEIELKQVKQKIADLK